MAKALNFHTWSQEKLKDRELSLGLLNRVINDSDKGLLMIILKDILLGFTTMTEISKVTSLSRTTLYRTFSGNVDVQKSTLEKLLGIAGFELAIVKTKKKNLAVNQTILKVAENPEFGENHVTK